VSSRLAGLVLLGAALAACSGSSTQQDSGGPVPDICNAPPADGGALDPACTLTLGQPAQYYINKAGKQLWLGVAIPSSTNPKSLLHLSAGYNVMSTPVELAVNLLDSQGATSLAAGSDSHASGRPHLIDFVLPYSAFSGAGSPLLIQCTDSTLLHFDDRAQFGILVEILPDPDPNTPGTPTPVAFTQSGGVSTGNCGGSPCTGVLSVSGRVDEFSFTPPASSAAHQVLYLDITAPASKLAPPVAYQLAYQLYDSSGTLIVTDYALSPYQDVNLATARLVSNPPYKLKVYAFNPPNATSPPAGDLRLTYTLDLRIMPDVDPQEQGATLNNSYATAAPVPFSAGDLGGASKILTGRLSYVGDVDWYALTLPSEPTTATRLHYKVTPTTNGGRFPSIPPLQPGNRIVEITTPVIASDPLTAQQICLANPATQCPVDTNASNIALMLQAALCNQGDGGALCLYSERQEAPGWDRLSNFEGIIPIQPHTGPVTYYLNYQSQEGTYADDLDYTVALSWQTEGSENQAGYHWTFDTGIAFPMTMQSSYSPVPPIGLSGTITLGHLYGKDTAPDHLPIDTLYTVNDYDALPSTIDTYVMEIPAGAAAAPNPFGVSWELQWTLSGFSGDAGAPIALGLEVAFCNGTIAGDAGCNIVSGSGPSTPTGNGPGLGTIGYDTTPAFSWYNYNAVYTGDLEPLWTLTNGPGSVTVTARPYGCFCLENAFLPAGKFYIQVVGLDRKVYQDVSYTLSTALAPYPQSFVVGDGGAALACPLNIPMADAGCQFTYMHP
jgi:hypothetical protein